MMSEPSEHAILLQHILDAGRDTAATTRDLVDVFRQHAADQARRETEHELAAQRRHEELRPMLDEYAAELRFRREETTKRVGSAVAATAAADKEREAYWSRVRSALVYGLSVLASAALAWGAARYGAPVAGGPPAAGAAVPPAGVAP